MASQKAPGPNVQCPGPNVRPHKLLAPMSNVNVNVGLQCRLNIDKNNQQTLLKTSSRKVTGTNSLVMIHKMGKKTKLGFLVVGVALGALCEIPGGLATPPLLPPITFKEVPKKTPPPKDSACLPSDSLPPLEPQVATVSSQVFKAVKFFLPSLASIKEKKIKSYAAVEDMLDNLLAIDGNLKPEDILVVSDWDNVISKVNGKNLPFREGKTTAKTLKSIQDKKIPFMVLTSRRPEDEMEAAEVSEMMNEALSLVDPALSLKKRSVFKNRKVQEDNGSFISGGIAFTSDKGPFLRKLVDENVLTKQPKVIFFIDDMSYNISSVKSAFRWSDSRLYLFHFPEK